MNCLRIRRSLLPLCQSSFSLFGFSYNYKYKLSSFFLKPISFPQTPRKVSVPSSSSSIHSPLSGMELEDVLVGYVLGKKKATEVAHFIWKHVVQKGDTVMDATCGNGYDTLAMLKLVADESGIGHVYGMDIQKDALESTTSLLDETLTVKEKELVQLFPICHSRMQEVVPENSPVRLVAFNLGYLPGGDKTVTTVSETTVLALGPAESILVPGGLISLVVYVGHPGGRKKPIYSPRCFHFVTLSAD